MPINSRDKGKRGEREVVQLLADWWGGTFERKRAGVPGSDINCPPGFPWAVEVKNTNDIRLRNLFCPNASLKSYWNQTISQATKEGRRPLLLAKIEGFWFVFCNESEVLRNIRAKVPVFDGVIALPIKHFIDEVER